jgi:DNA repair exonuclease SbcCD nuclease subunit
VKLLICSDLHVSGVQATSRLDDSFQTDLEQLEWILEYAEKEKCDAILHTGDFWDYHEQTAKTVNRVIEVFKRYRKVPCVSVCGNHDTTGKRTERYIDKPLGTLEAAECLTVLREAQEPWSVDCKVDVYGFGESEEATKQLLEGSWEVDREHNAAEITIGLIHASIGPDDCMSRWESISTQKISGLTFACFGDIHVPFGTYIFENGVAAIHPGAIGRRNIDDQERMPQIAILDPYKWSVDYIDVPSNARFMERTVTVEKEDTAAEFKEILHNARLKKDESPRQRIERLGIALKFSEKSVGTLIEAL